MPGDSSRNGNDVDVLPFFWFEKTEKMRKNSKKETNNHLESWLVNRIQFDTGIKKLSQNMLWGIFCDS